MINKNKYMALSEMKKQKIEEEEKYRHTVASSISTSKAVQKHGVPLLLSFFIPGLGQLVKGQVKKGLLIFFSPIVTFLLVALLGISIDGVAVLGLLGYYWLGVVILYIWQLIDSYNN